MPEAEILKSIDEKMKRSLAALKGEFSKIRGNRATTAVLDDIRVDYYGAMTPLNQMATLSTPDPRTITIAPWDKSAIATIEKSLQAANLGFGVGNDGTVVRASLPPLSEERRKDLVKVLKKLAEEARVSVRHVRREANDLVKGELKDKTITEDEEKRISKKIQDLTDEANRQVEVLVTGKEKDIMEV